jgi:hypothetical protein
MRTLARHSGTTNATAYRMSNNDMPILRRCRPRRTTSFTSLPIVLLDRSPYGLRRPWALLYSSGAHTIIPVHSDGTLSHCKTSNNWGTRRAHISECPNATIAGLPCHRRGWRSWMSRSDVASRCSQRGEVRLVTVMRLCGVGTRERPVTVPLATATRFASSQRVTPVGGGRPAHRLSGRPSYAATLLVIPYSLVVVVGLIRFGGRFDYAAWVARRSNAAGLI